MEYEAHNVDVLVDQPCLFFWKQFAQIWPKAKIILTMRDNTDVWWRSAKERVLFFLFENEKPSLFREFFKNLSRKISDRKIMLFLRV